MHMVFAGGGDETKSSWDRFLLNLIVSQIRCGCCGLERGRRKDCVLLRVAEGLGIVLGY